MVADLGTTASIVKKHFEVLPVEIVVEFVVLFTLRHLLRVVVLLDHVQLPRGLAFLKLTARSHRGGCRVGKREMLLTLRLSISNSTFEVCMHNALSALFSLEHIFHVLLHRRRL